MPTGIYKIIHTESGRYYIGSSINIEKRWWKHKNDLKNGDHHSIYLQRLWNKYGEDAFEFQIFEETTDLIQREQELLDEGSPLLLNMSRNAAGGDLISYHPNRKDIVRRMAASVQERYNNLTQEQKTEIYGRFGSDNPNYGNPWNEDQRARARAQHIGKTHTPETRAKMGAIVKERWSNPEFREQQCQLRLGEGNPFFGKHHSEETIEKIRQKNKGRLPPNLRRVSANGVVYDSLAEAARQLNVVIGTIFHRIKSKNPKFISYFYVDNDLARDCLNESSPV